MGRFRRRPIPADPHWITARYDGACSTPGCAVPVRKGDRVYDYPNGASTYCTGCSPDVARRAEAELMDEDLLCCR